MSKDPLTTKSDLSRFPRVFERGRDDGVVPKRTEALDRALGTLKAKGVIRASDVPLSDFVAPFEASLPALAGAIDVGPQTMNIPVRVKARKSSEGGVGAHAADRRKSRSAGNCRPVTGGKVSGSDGDPGLIGPQGGNQSSPSDPKKGGRPKVVGEPWVELGMTKRTYYRRKKAGTL